MQVHTCLRLPITTNPFVNPPHQLLINPHSPPLLHYRQGFYGHHHSRSNWGASPYEFNPDREWEPRELQLNDDGGIHGWGTGMTPCTQRFHPFSLPRRDCLGKGFALTEMRTLLPKVLCEFRLSILKGSELESVSPHCDDGVYANWARNISGPVQPHEMWLDVSPLPQASRL